MNLTNFFFVSSLRSGLEKHPDALCQFSPQYSQTSLEASFLVDATEFAETLGFFDFFVEAELVDTRLLVSDVCCLSETSCAFSTQ